MSIIDRIKGNPFERLKRDELTEERIKLERDEKLKIAEVNKLSNQKKDLFNKGFQVSEAERRSLARELQVLDQKIKHSNILLKKISDQIRVVDNLTFIHENRQMFERYGLIKQLSKIPKSKLDDFLAKVNVEEQMKGGKIEMVLATMMTEYGLLTEVEDDKETAKLMDIWSSGDAAQADEVYKEWDREKATEEREVELE